MQKETIFQFIDAINRQDLERIIKMMSDDFCFINTYGDQENKEQMKTGWKDYFDWFPDYRIKVQDYVESDDFSLIVGEASASYQGNQAKH